VIPWTCVRIPDDVIHARKEIHRKNHENKKKERRMQNMHPSRYTRLPHPVVDGSAATPLPHILMINEIPSGFKIESKNKKRKKREKLLVFCLSTESVRE